MRKRLIRLGNGRLIYTREPVQEEAMDAREPVNEDGDEWEEGGKGGGVSGGGAGMKEEEVDEVTHGCEGNGDAEMEGACSDDEEGGKSDSDDSFIDDSLDGEEPLVSENDNDSHAEVPPLTDAEVEELVSELLEIESKAAEAQETLELESLKQVENEVRAELAQNLQGDELEKAVTTEMKTFTEQWEMTLDELETESALLLEQLDGAGVGLPSLYKWVESQVPNGCSTEAWRNRAHWVGSQVTAEVNEAVAAAEKHLQSCRPVRKKHGKLLEEGAGGFLARKLAITENGTLNENPGKDWSSFNEYIKSAKHDDISLSFGSEQWASVYLASTPQQAANMGLAFPGVDEVEEIDEICTDSCDPFYADALSNEKGIDLSEEQKRNFRKIREEDDAIITKKLQNHLKRRRHKSRNCQIHSEDGGLCSDGISAHKVASDAFACSDLNGSSIGNLMNSSRAMTSRDGKHLWHSEDIDTSNRKCPTVIIDSDDEVQLVDKLDANICSPHESGGQSSIQAKDAVDIIDVDSFQATEFMKDFNCTACIKGLQASQVHKHPLLGVIVCEHCKCVVEENMQSKGLEPANCYCRWCGRSTDLMNCNSCNMLFCTTCIKRNLGEDQLLESKASSWQCCCCSPNLLRKLISDYEIASGSIVVCSSEGESELSDSDSNISTSKKKRKRKIRRILDDAELREETKQKIEIEKARQEHLKSMQFAGYWSKNEALIQNMAEGATVEVLGDATMGYIVNVAREEDEEPVRIPPSISSKLKPHQIVGIRFMWENIIQSVRKVQSGDKGLGCILAHTMGLGKTFQVIAFLYTALRSINLGLKTALIVTPVNVLHNWRHEFMKWKPVDVKTLHVFMLEDVHRDKRAHLLSKWRAKGGVLLIGYAAFRDLSFGKHVKDRNKAIEICYALQHGADILVCDEAHMIKNTRADITHALKQVKSQRRIALTGSPLQNNLMEYYCMVDFVREGFLGSGHEFKNRFQNPIENGQHTNSTSDDVKIMNQRSHILYEQLKGFVQRMDMNVVKNELPPKTVYVISVKLSPLQKKLYKRFLDVHGYTDKLVSTDKTVRRSCFFAGYQALAQIWNHPGLLQMAKELKGNRIREDIVENFLGDDTSSDDNIGHSDLLDGGNHRSKNDSLHKRSDQIFFPEEVDWWKDLLRDKIYKEVDYSGKMVLLLDILTMSYEVGDKTLVFSQSLATLDLIELFLSKFPRKGREGKYWKQGKDWYRLDGRTKGSERQKIIERFNETSNKRVKCTLISTRAGSLGVNLHAANRVIIVDGSWNPTNDLQAIYRVWRYGQMKPVYVYRLMAHKTMEEKIYKRQVTKEGLAARVVDRQQIHRTMSKEEVLHLFDFGDDENIDSVLEQIQDTPLPSNQERKSGLADFMKQKSISATHEVGLSDKFMESLLNRYYPRWIQDFHEHETLLQENEEERLSKEEQDMAWETFLRTIEWEEVKRVPEEPVKFEQKPPKNPASENNYTLQGKGCLQNQPPVSLRKCTNLSHLLTLRSQGTKSGSCTVCKECSQEISWENLSRDGRPR